MYFVIFYYTANYKEYFVFHEYRGKSSWLFCFFSIKYSTETSKEIVEPTRILRSDK